MNSIITTYNVSTYFKIVIIKDSLYILDIKEKHVQYHFFKGENKDSAIMEKTLAVRRWDRAI